MYTFTMVGCTLFKLCHYKCAKAYLLEILGMSRLWHDLMAHGLKLIERMRTPVRHFSYGIRHYPVHTLLSRMYGTITTDAGSPVFGIPGLLH